MPSKFWLERLPASGEGGFVGNLGKQNGKFEDDKKRKVRVGTVF